MPDKLTFIALNEFNLELLKAVSELLPKNNYLSRLMDLKLVESTTDDNLDSDFLEPWVQWVSIQTGTPATVHGIKNLGDIPNLNHPQIWELLSKVGKSCVIWGAMNASRGTAKNCKIFIPDPWVFDEPPFPEKISSFVELPRYIAKNYTSLSRLKVAKLIFCFLKQSAHLAGVQAVVRSLTILLKGITRFGPQKFVFICFFDYLSAAAFARCAKFENANLSYLFLNSIAHVQHHYWHSPDILQLKEIIFTFKTVERILCLIDNVLGLFSNDNPMIVCNALSQINTRKELPWVLYRIKNMDNLLGRMAIRFSRVETLMSYDGHIIFENGQDLELAEAALCEVQVNGHRLFKVEANKTNYQLFFRIIVSERVSSESLISAGKQTFVFGDEVQEIVTRTGKHYPGGCAYHNIDDLDFGELQPIKNHELFGLIFPELFEDGLSGERPQTELTMSER